MESEATAKRQALGGESINDAEAARQAAAAEAAKKQVEQEAMAAATAKVVADAEAIIARQRQTAVDMLVRPGTTGFAVRVPIPLS